jgi:TP901 family phage tail tape measure protein
METVAFLQAVVSADTADFESGMVRVQQKAQGTMNFLGGLGDFGKALTMGLTLPLVAAGVAIADTGMQFDAQMRNINSLTQKGEEDFASFSSQVNSFASQTTYGSLKVADALYNIVSAGIGVKDTAEAMELLGVSTRLAESGRDDLNRTTQALIALEGNFGIAGYSAQRLGDITAAMVQAGVGEMHTYTQNLAKALPASVNLGMSYEELAGDIALLSRTYGNGSKPMTAMGMLMSNLMKPTEGLTAALEGLGVASSQELIEKFGGLNEALFALKGSVDPTVFQKMFSKTGFEAVLLLTNDIDHTREILNDFYASIGGSIDRAWEQQMMSFSAAFDRAKAAIQGVAVVLSRTLLPILGPIFNLVADVANAFIAADPALQSAVVVFGMIAAAAGPLIWIGATLVGSFSPFGLLIKGIAGGAALAAGNFGGFGDAVKNFAAEAMKVLQPILDILVTIGKLITAPMDGMTNQPQLLPEGMTLYEDGSIGKKWNDAWNFTLPDPATLMEFDTPQSLWQIYEENGWDDKYSWKEFMKAAYAGGWDGKAVSGTKPITIDGKTLFELDTGDLIYTAEQYSTQWTTQFGWGLEKGFNNFDYKLTTTGLKAQLAGQIQTLIDSLKETIPAAVKSLSTMVGQGAAIVGTIFTDILTGAWAFIAGGGAGAAAGGLVSFVRDNIITPFANEFGKAWPEIQLKLGALWTSIVGWFDTKIGAGISFLAGLFGGTSASGGETPVYTAVRSLLEGDIFAAINAIIPGLGDKLSNLIGGDWGEKIGNAFPQIEAGLSKLATNFGDWFTNDALPTVSRSIGFFMGRIGGMLYGGFKDVIGGIGKGGIDAGGAVGAMGDAVFTPFASGLQEGMASTGEVDMSDTFSGFAEQLVSSLAGAVGLAALAAGAWGLATDGIFGGLKLALKVPMWFAGSMLNVGMDIAGAVASATATKLGIAATWGGFGGAIVRGINSLPALAMSGLSWVLSAGSSIASSIVAYLGLSTSWSGLAGAISLGLQAVKVITLTVVDFAATVAGAIAGPILTQLGITTTWTTLSTAIGTAISAELATAKVIISSASQFAGTIATAITDKIRLAVAWTGIGTAISTGISAVAAPVMLALTSAAGWASAIAAPLVAAVGSAAAWAGITGSLWLAAAPILAMGVAVAAVIAQLNNYNNTIEAGVVNAQVAVKIGTDAGELTEAQIDEQVFASIQSSPLGDIGARLFYTNFKAQIMGDVEFEADGVTLKGQLPTLTDQTLQVSGDVEWTSNTTSTLGDILNSAREAVTGGAERPGGTGTKLALLDASSFIDPATPAQVQTLADDTIKRIDETVATFGEKTAAMVADGTLDPETINTNFLVPLSTYWAATFGSGGTLATASLGFSTSFKTQMAAVGTDVTAMVTTSTEQLTMLYDAFTLNKDHLPRVVESLRTGVEAQLTQFASTMHKNMSSAANSVNMVTLALGGLMAALALVGTMKLPTLGGGGGGGVDGSHADGLDYVPWDGYIAELHKGEKVLTAGQAKTLNTPATSISNSNSRTNNSNNSVVINIQGVQDVDSLLKELKRRGYNIG